MKQYQSLDKNKINKPNSFRRFIGSQMFHQYYTSLCFFANKILEDRPAAEDVVEDVFINLWRKDPDLENYNNIKAVLYTSVRNACFDFIKNRRNNILRRSDHAYLLAQESED